MSLHQAIRDNNLEKVRDLIATGSEVNAADSSRRTPLHLAVWSGNIEIIKLLLISNANVMAKAQDNFLPLHFGVQKPLLKEVIKLLVRKDKTSLRSTISKGNKTALHIAASKGQFEHVKTLVELGADLKSKTFQGKIAQELATTSEISEYLNQQLLEQVKRNAPNPDGSNSRKRQAMAAALQGSSSETTKGNDVTEENEEDDDEDEESTNIHNLNNVVKVQVNVDEPTQTVPTSSSLSVAVNEDEQGGNELRVSPEESVPQKKQKVDVVGPPNKGIIHYADQE